MIKNGLMLLALLVPFTTWSQLSTLKGEVIDSTGAPLPYATVTLLDPSDSTLLHYSITNAMGAFELSKVPNAKYILQIAFIGYQTQSHAIEVPFANPKNYISIVLNPVSFDLDAVQVKAERVPLLIKKDTIEYNAAAFKTKPDAIAEDLLRKLPGVEVDRAGNVKAMGENVNRVLVDGKEFFSNDPKVATKNLPAESINKVQVYDKKSDESELLGIDDSEYDKTINFVLKDDMKQAIFGDVKAGGDAQNYYQGNAKVYRFTEKHQFAALGMLNNVNRPGFSFQDYLDFNGGLKNLMGGNGGSLTLNASDNLPIDFGQSVNGLIKSGAGGVNYSYELAKNNRFNISYMVNGANKSIDETMHSRNFTTTDNFEQNANELGSNNNANHHFNIGWRNKSGSKQHFMLNGIATISNSSMESKESKQSYSNEALVNSLNSNTNGNNKSLSSTAEGSWLRKLSGNWQMVKLKGKVNYNQTLRKSDWHNLSLFTGSPSAVEEFAYSENSTSLLSYQADVSTLRKMGKGFYIEAELNAGSYRENLSREQGNITPAHSPIDTLSPNLKQDYAWVKPATTLKYYTKNTKLNIGVEYELGEQNNWLNDTAKVTSTTAHLHPMLSWDYEYRTGRRFSLKYNTNTVNPTPSQLIPIISSSSPLVTYFGNRNLEPEYRHRLHLSWFLFDQFSFTSVFTNVTAAYTRNKINRAQTISDDLKQTFTLVNVPDDYLVTGGASVSTPIRSLGISTSVSINETWNRGINFVNGIQNINTSITHKLTAKINNRKTDKWDIEIGGDISLTNARYSIQKQLNREYISYSAFGEIRYKPSDNWHFRLTTDITSYSAQSFTKDITIPLMGAEVSYYFLKNKRGVLSLEGYDLLNKNTGISRVAELNYLSEVNSSTIGRYILLSFKYKLNSMGNENSIQIKNR